MVMIKKQVTCILLMAVFSIAVNNCWGQSAYVEFGDPTMGCKGTGLCDVEVNAPSNQYAHVKLSATNIIPSNPPTCTVVIKISHRQAKVGQSSPIQYLRAGNYTFTHSVPISTYDFGVNSQIYQQYGMMANYKVQVPPNAQNVTVVRGFFGRFKITIPNCTIVPNK